MNRVFQQNYKLKFKSVGLLDKCGGDLQHLISDAATMQIVRWTDGGFGMASHNYDGDMLTDEIAQIHRSPGFITSNLIGRKADGTLIKEFEASHGTVADMWAAHQEGKETSMNPLGMVEALIGALDHAAALEGGASEPQVNAFTGRLRRTMHGLMVNGQGTRDLCGDSGLTTEGFINAVAEHLKGEEKPILAVKETKKVEKNQKNANLGQMREIFDELDVNKDGELSFEEFAKLAVRLNIAPKTGVKELTKVHEVSNTKKEL